jgi:hypothetical protein
MISSQFRTQCIDQRLKLHAAFTDPLCQCRARDRVAGALEDGFLPVQRQVSGAGESHPHALPEPDVNLSTHPAPIVQSS